MKRILVIGENSYIGKSFEAFAKDRYEIKIVSSRNDTWKNVDFTGYDSVLHCAGIAHVKQKKKMEWMYYKVNCDLAVDIALIAKDFGVNQFIFLSSMAVHGTKKSEIDVNTIPNPNKGDFYGYSKLKAENELKKLEDDKFKLCIVRPPMVYGKGCKGNFPKLVKLAKITPVFPNYPNKRSMIYIENLCSFLCELIDNNNIGVFLPQNSEYVNTTKLVKYIAEINKRKIILIKLFNPFISIFLNNINVVNKLLGDLIYKKSLNENFKYCTTDFETSIFKSGVSDE